MVEFMAYQFDMLIYAVDVLVTFDITYRKDVGYMKGHNMAYR